MTIDEALLSLAASVGNLHKVIISQEERIKELENIYKTNN